MAKIIGFIRRRPDFDLAAFSAHWRTTHREHTLKLSRWLTGYKQAHLLLGPVPDMQRPADGCPILWIDRIEDMADLAASDECRRGASLDEPNFMEGRSSGLPVDEQIFVPPPARHAVKLMLFLRARRGEAVGDAPGWSTARANGHVRNRAVMHGGIDPAVAFDLVEEIWWPDEAAYRADLAVSLPFPIAGWIDPVRSRAALVDELVVIPPRG